MKYQPIIDDLNSDVAKLSELLTTTENPEVQNALFKLLRILKNWRRILTATKEDYANDAEATI